MNTKKMQLVWIIRIKTILEQLVTYLKIAIHSPHYNFSCSRWSLCCYFLQLICTFEGTTWPLRSCDLSLRTCINRLLTDSCCVQPCQNTHARALHCGLCAFCLCKRHATHACLSRGAAEWSLFSDKLVVIRLLSLTIRTISWTKTKIFLQHCCHCSNRRSTVLVKCVQIVMHKRKKNISVTKTTTWVAVF